MGSVFGLNIRNLAWHGFLGAEDIHPEHGALILFGLHRCQEPLQKRVGAPSALNLDHIWKVINKYLQLIILPYILSIVLSSKIRACHKGRLERIRDAGL